MRSENTREVRNDELVVLRRGDSENREQGDHSVGYLAVNDTSEMY